MKDNNEVSVSETKGEITTRITVEKIENGFLITKNIYGNKKGKWFDENKKFYSETNPLDKKEDKDLDKTTSKDILSALDNIFSFR